jgi:hypothetical protein
MVRCRWCGQDYEAGCSSECAERYDELYTYGTYSDGEIE